MFNAVNTSAAKLNADVFKVLPNECFVGLSNGTPLARGNVVVGNSNATTGYSNVVVGNKINASGSNNVVYGTNITVSGHGNVILGASRTGSLVVTTNSNVYIGGVRFVQTAFGDTNTITPIAAEIPYPTGSAGTMTSNISLGYGNTTSGTVTSNMFFGHLNTMSGVTHRANIVFGQVNGFSGTCLSNIVEGGSNSLSGCTENVIMGYNTSLVSCSKCVVIGATPQTLTSKTSTIFIGNQMTVTPSLATVSNLSVVDLTASTLSGLTSLQINQADSTPGWTLSATASNLAFVPISAPTSRFIISKTFDTVPLSFTGVHRCVVKENAFCPLFQGALVRTTGEVKNLDGSTVPGEEAIPVVEVTTRALDKTVFGVFSKYENNVDGWRSFQYGNMCMEARCKETRAHINSSGEGSLYAIGPVDVGDLLCSSSSPGKAQRQPNQEFVTNYTVAKATSRLDLGEEGLVGAIYLL